MDMLADVAATIIAQMQKPTLAFLIGGMMLAALGSKLKVPEPVYRFIVLLLLLKVGMGAGISVREADFVELLVPGLLAVAVGVTIVLLGSRTLAGFKGVSNTDGMATAGLFGAVSASTLAAGMSVLDGESIYCEGFIAALYPFMDVAALVTAIVLAKMAAARKSASSVQGGVMTMGGDTHINRNAKEDAEIEDGLIKGILTDTLKSSAISALLLGLALGVFARPDSVYASFYEPLFRGLLSVLMLIMGMEAWSRLADLRKVAHAYVIYGLTAPLVHGMIGFGAGLIAHHMTGFSAGGVVLLAIMAASSSDISGPPTMRAALPEANPSAYVGASTGLGTPVAILSIPMFMALADWAIGF